MHDEQKSREHELAPELAALERQLRGMTPAAPRIDRDQMMFAAGQAAGAALIVEPGQHGRAMYDNAGHPMYLAGPSWADRRFWPAVAVTMTAATFLLAVLLVWQRQSFQVASHGDEQLPTTIPVSEQPRMAMADSSNRLGMSPLGLPIFQPTSRNGYLSVRYVALRRGVDALEPTFPDATGQDTAGDYESTSEKPPTQRNMLEELLPSRRHELNSRS
jgi:hypothetical protein